MEGDEGESVAPESLIKVVETGKKLVDIVEETGGRENIVKSEIKDPVTFKSRERVFTEQEGIDNLVGFVDEILKTAGEHGDAAIKEKAELFRDNLVFVGETELEKATQGIAQHLLEEAQKGKTVVLFPANVRSERYISLRILEQLNRLTETTQELRKTIKVTESVAEVTELVKSSLGECLIAVPDDFVVSGTRIQGFAGRIYNSLLEAGFSPQKASELIEANTVATRVGTDENKLTLGKKEEGTETDLRIFSYYRVPEYGDSSGKWAVFTGISLTGAHSSTDYGFEMVLEDFQKYMAGKGLHRDLPLLSNIKRPYQMPEDGSLRYSDNELQLRWEKMKEVYGLKQGPIS